MMTVKPLSQVLKMAQQYQANNVIIMLVNSAEEQCKNMVKAVTDREAATDSDGRPDKTEAIGTAVTFLKVLKIVSNVDEVLGTSESIKMDWGGDVYEFLNWGLVISYAKPFGTQSPGQIDSVLDNWTSKLRRETLVGIYSGGSWVRVSDSFDRSVSASLGWNISGL
jgi:hypothetical protein